jgi:hypothetical protein
MIYGIDISNLQGPPSSYRNQGWYHYAEFVIVQAIQPPYPYQGWDHTDAVTGLRGFTGEQLTTAREDGKKVGVYAFLWNTLPNRYADILARFNIVPKGFPLDMRPWVDVEDTAATSVQQRRTATLAAREAGDAFAAARGLRPCGGYSGAWYVQDYLDNWWPDGWLRWWADYSKPAGSLLGGLTVGHQFTSNPVDTSVLIESELEIGGGKVAIKVGEGLQARMDSVGDQPLFGHMWRKETDDDGNEYDIEECYGTLGRYVAANSSGEWVTGGPF